MNFVIKYDDGWYPRLETVRSKRKFRNKKKPLGSSRLQFTPASFYILHLSFLALSSEYSEFIMQFRKSL
jgi:hypothetical protein